MNQCVIISGAHGGIGSAAAVAFAQHGFNVLAADIADAPANIFDGLPIRSIKADVTDESQVADIFTHLGPQDTLAHVIAVAGGLLPLEKAAVDPLDIAPVEVFNDSLKLNLVAPYILLRNSLKLLEQNAAAGGTPSVCLISSINAFASYGGPGYSAAKSGLIGLVNQLCGPLGKAGIRINAVAPGTVITDRTRELYADNPNHFERLAESTALHRLATPDDIARSILSLTADMTHVTGQTLIVDGGQMLVRR